MVKWLVEHFNYCIEEVVEEAAAAGDMAILEYFFEKDINNARNLPLKSFREVRWGNRDMARAVAAGHSDVVVWLQRTEVEVHRDDKATMIAAIANGDFELVNLVRGVVHISPTIGVLQAAEHGHLGLLVWMDELISSNETVGMLVKAAEKGHLNVVRWLIERDWSNIDLNSDSDSEDDWDFGYFGWGGRREHTRPTHVTSVGEEGYLTIHAAANNGHLEVAEYIRARVDTPLDRDDQKEEKQRQTKTIEH